MTPKYLPERARGKRMKRRKNHCEINECGWVTERKERPLTTQKLFYCLCVTDEKNSTLLEKEGILYVHRDANQPHWAAHGVELENFSLRIFQPFRGTSKASINFSWDQDGVTEMNVFLFDAASSSLNEKRWGRIRKFEFNNSSEFLSALLNIRSL